jgi:hypothetical protein
MSAEVYVEEVFELPDGTLLVRGARRTCECIQVGLRGTCMVKGDSIVCEIIGLGVVDPNLSSKGRQGLLLRLISGNGESLRGSVINFNSRV